MKKNLLKLFFIAATILSSLYFIPSASAAECSISSVNWNSQTSISLGSPTPMKILGQGLCSGKAVIIDVMESDGLGVPASVDDSIRTGLQVFFPNQSGESHILSTSQIFLQNDYIKGDDTSEGEEEEFYFSARLASSDRRSYSPSINFAKPSSSGSSQCNITSAEWSYTQPKVGQTAAVIVRGIGCPSFAVNIRIREDDGDSISPSTIDFNDNIESFNIRFDSAGREARGNWVIKSQGGPELVSRFYFNATADKSTRTSNVMVVSATADALGGGSTSGPGGSTGSGNGTGAGTGSGTPGGAVSFDFTIKPPNQFQDITQLIDAIMGWMYKIALPLGVAAIVYAGFLYMTSQGNPTKVQEATKILKYTVLGLAIILIGTGFVSLIQSIVDLGTTGNSSGEACSPSNCASPKACFDGVCRDPNNTSR
jgi:hypothetical protein